MRDVFFFIPPALLIVDRRRAKEIGSDTDSVPGQVWSFTSAASENLVTPAGANHEYRRIQPMRHLIIATLLMFGLAIASVPRATAAEDGGSGRRTEFRGVIESLPSGSLIGVWVVGGRRVQVSDTTRINQEHGAPRVGAAVEVHGLITGSTAPITATEIEVLDDPAEAHRVEFRGVIERLPDGGLIGTWVISARRVHVSETTVINQEHGAARVGAVVEVHGVVRDDAEVNATEIEVQPGQDDGQRVEFRGTVESLPVGGLIGTWVVSGQRVNVTESTRIDQEHGRAQVGSLVEVHGVQQSGQGIVTANEIEVKSSPDDPARFMEFRGTITALPPSGLLGDWQVDGRTVHVNERTRVDQEHGRAAVGALVEVKGWAQADGSVLADSIEVKPDADAGRDVQFRGTIDRLPGSGLVGDWIVSGRTVHVTENTRIKNRDRIQVGATAVVTGVGQTDGSVMATIIKVKG